MPKKLIKIQHPEDEPEPLTSIQIPDKRPVLGMTLVRLTGAFSVDNLSKLSKKNPDLKVFDEILSLQRQMYICENMTVFLGRFHTRNGEIKSSHKETLKNEVERIKNIFGLQLDEEIKHIHTKPLGKGAFTLFGFVYDNVFEVLLLDPLHEIAN